MKVTLLLMLILFVGCGKKAAISDPMGADPNFKVALLDSNGDEVTEIALPDMDPTFAIDDKVEMIITVKNVGTAAGDAAFGNSSTQFVPTAMDSRCDGSYSLLPGESCQIKVTFYLQGAVDGPYSGTISLWSDGEIYKVYSTTINVATTI